MPHVVIKGGFSISDYGRIFLPLYENEEWLIKIDEYFIERGGSKALLPVVVVEEGHSQKFYVKISANEENHSFTIRLDPSTDPVKTIGVKRSLALVTESILEKYKEATVVRHNLQHLLNTPV